MFLFVGILKLKIEILVVYFDGDTQEERDDNYDFVILQMVG